MSKVQQDVMCVLLQTLLERELIAQDVHDQARTVILGKPDWPKFFRDGGKEKLCGSA